MRPGFSWRPGEALPWRTRTNRIPIRRLPTRAAWRTIRSADLGRPFPAASIVAAASFAADPANADAQSANLPWVALGPRNVGGRIRCIAQDPINTATLYAGSAFGGLWKTENRGDTWRPIGFFLPAPAHAERFRRRSAPSGYATACPRPCMSGPVSRCRTRSPGIGLYRSIDGGATFQRTRRGGQWRHDRRRPL